MNLGKEHIQVDHQMDPNYQNHYQKKKKKILMAR